MKTMLVPDVILSAMSAGAVIAASISGGKDSQAMTNLLRIMCDGIGHEHIFALHMDLGRAEWHQTPAEVERIARENNLPLTVVRRPQGDLVQEIEDRMIKLQGTDKPFWPSSAARYCTADQKRSQADKVYRQHDLIISAEGNRAQESPKRRKDPAISVRKQVTAAPLRDLSPEDAVDMWITIKRLLDAGDTAVIEQEYPDFVYYTQKNAPFRLALTWYPIHDLLIEEVWNACGTSIVELQQRRQLYEDGKEDEALDGWPCHPAYVLGNDRLSCALCVLATDNDIRNGAEHNPELAAHYLYLERVGGSTFKNGRSLAEILDGKNKNSKAQPIQLGLFWDGQRPSCSKEATFYMTRDN